MTDCVFCKIIAGSIPSRIVYRDAHVICFLPRKQEASGHTLIAPVKHIQDIYAANPADLQLLLTAAQKLALHYRKQIGATGINLLHASGTSAQQSVGHMHIHLIPRFDADGLDTWPKFPAISLNPDEQLKMLRLDTPDA